MKVNASTPQGTKPIDANEILATLATIQGFSGSLYSKVYQEFEALNKEQFPNE